MNENTRVALILSLVAKLEQCFHESASDTFKQEYLKAAGDALDKTVPPLEVKKAMPKEAGRQVPFLVAHAAQLGAVPPGLWRRAHADLRKLPQPDSERIRRMDDLLKTGTCTDATWSNLSNWLAPVWDAYPALCSYVKAESFLSRES